MRCHRIVDIQKVTVAVPRTIIGEDSVPAMKPDRRNIIAVTMADLKVIDQVGQREGIRHGDSTARLMVEARMGAVQEVGVRPGAQTALAKKAAGQQPRKR